MSFISVRRFFSTNPNEAASFKTRFISVDGGWNGFFVEKPRIILRGRSLSCRGQTTVELMALLAISLVALAIIFFIYTNQIELNNISKERTVASNTVKDLVNAANSLYISGAGSKTRVLVSIPEGLKMADSNIIGPVLVLVLSDGSNVFGMADVNFSGAWKMLGGEYVTGGYYATLSFNGTTVSMSYDDFELSTQSIAFSAEQGSITQKNFSVRNLSDYNAVFWVSSSFSHSPYASLSIKSEDVFFTLAPNVSKRVDLNIVLSNYAYGNYSGTLSVVGQIDNGILDANVTKTIIVSGEAFFAQDDLMIYPKISTISNSVGSINSQRYSICNSSSLDVNGISWSRDSNSDANMLSWFTWPIIDLNGNSITSVAASNCKQFDLNLTIPLSASSKNYDANFSAAFDTNKSYSYFYVTPAFYKSLFFTSQNDFNSNQNWSSSYFARATQSNWASPTGELDWNGAANYSYQGVDFNRDMNGLIAYYKFNDKNASNWIVNSATGAYEAQLVGDADTNAIGLWDTNAGYFAGDDDYVNISDNQGIDSAVNDISISMWIKPQATQSSSYVGLIDRHSCTSQGFTLQQEGSTTNAFYFGINIGGTWYCNEAKSAYTQLTANVWQNFVVERVGSKVYHYLNGNLTVNCNATSGVITSTDNPLKIGYSCGARYFNGILDEVKLYNRALSASEISADFNSFLNARYVSDVEDLFTVQNPDFNFLRVNSDVNFNFGHEIEAGEKFFDINLVGLWHLNDKNSQGWVLNSATSIRDGNLVGNADTINTGLWDTNAGYFDGNGDYISLPLFHPDEVTYTAWIKTSSSDGAIIGTNFGNAPTFWHGGIRVSSGKARMDIGYPLSSYQYVDGTIPVNDNKWHFIVMTSNPSGSFLYVDSVRDGNSSYYVGQVPGSSETNTNIGVRQSYDFVLERIIFENYFTGSIEETAIWSRALSASEINDLYRKGAARLDLNIYSCSDSSCNSVVDFEEYSAIRNNYLLSLSSLNSARYFKYIAGFNYNSNVVDINSTGSVASIGFPYLSDVNLFYYN